MRLQNTTLHIYRVPFVFSLCRAAECIEEIMLIQHRVVVALLVIFVRNAHSTIWIKNVRSQGPAAAIAGTKCLATFTQYYFWDSSVTRTKNMVVSYTRSISSPAKEIQQQYLEWLHHIIAGGDMERCVQRK